MVGAWTALLVALALALALEVATVEARAPGAAPSFFLDELSSNHSLIRAELGARGWVECVDKRVCRHTADLMWTWSPRRWSRGVVGAPERLLNHFHNVDEIDDKVRMLENLRRVHGPDMGGLVPETFSSDSTSDRAQLAEIIAREHTAELGLGPRPGSGPGPGAAWIAKSAAGTRGDGIELFARAADALAFADAPESAPLRPFALQRYIANPALVLGRKFDIRQFALVRSLAPLQVFMLDTCYARFASSPFSLDSLGDRYAHLTNHQVQKNSPHYAESPIVGNQMSCAALGDALAANGGPAWATVAQEIGRIVRDVALAWPQEGHRARSFELVGLDVLLDESGRAWLLEVNTSPGLHLTTDVVRAHHSYAIRALATALLDDERTAFRADGAPTPALAACDVRARDAPACDLRVGGWTLVYAGAPVDSHVLARASAAFQSFVHARTDGVRVRKLATPTAGHSEL